MAMSEGCYDITQSHERIPGCMIFRAGDGVHAAWLDHRARGKSAVARMIARFSPFHRNILKQEAAMLASAALKAVICNSVMVRNEMQRYYDVPESKLVLIENGVDLESFHPRLSGKWREKQRLVLGIDADTPVFLFVGSGFERKGMPQLLSALAGMKMQQAHLVVVGQDRQLSAYQRQVKKLGLGSRVHFLGPQQDVRPYYSVLNYSVTKGNVIANDNINAMEALTWKRFNYESPFDAQGSAPPGFSGLIGQATAGYVTTPSSWREI